MIHLICAGIVRRIGVIGCLNMLFLWLADWKFMANVFEVSILYLIIA